jgi:hypothetical protein
MGRPSWPKWSLCPPGAEDEEGAEKKQLRNWPRISLLPSPACTGASAVKTRMLPLEHQGCEDLNAKRDELEYLVGHVRNVMMREELLPCQSRAPSLPQQQQEPPTTAASDKLHDDEDELRSVRALYTQSQKDLAQLLQRLILHTFFDASQAEAHRASLEQHLQQETKRLAAKYQIGVVQLPCVPKVRLPLSSEGVPELKLKSCNDASGSSLWSIRVTPGQVMTDVSPPICFLQSPAERRAQSSPCCSCKL